MVSGGSAPATSLVAQAGGTTRYNEQRGVFDVLSMPDGVHVAGELMGIADLRSAESSGAAAGAEAAHALGFGDADRAPAPRRIATGRAPGVVGRRTSRCRRPS